MSSGFDAPEITACALEGVQGPSAIAPTQIKWSPLATSVMTCIEGFCTTLSADGTTLSQPHRSEADTIRASFVAVCCIIL
jgi:hypothetical protein